MLCLLEGKSSAEAETQLGLKLGTFSARLTRAKQTLMDRLAERGLSAGLIALGGIGLGGCGGLGGWAFGLVGRNGRCGRRDGRRR